MDDTATKIIDILKKHMKEPRDDIGLETPMADLKIESVDLALIIFEIEDAYGVTIVEANLDTFKTFGEARDLVLRLLSEKAIRKSA